MLARLVFYIYLLGMREFESTSSAEIQALVCYELASELKSKLIQHRESDVVKLKYLIEDTNFEYEGKKFGGEYHWYLFFPFNSKVGRDESRWLAGLEAREYEDFTNSGVHLYQVPLDSAGNLRLESRESSYSIHDHSILSHNMIIKRFNSRNIPRRPNGFMDVQALVAPDTDDATTIRILLEDALAQLD